MPINRFHLSVFQLKLDTSRNVYNHLDNVINVGAFALTTTIASLVLYFVG